MSDRPDNRDRALQAAAPLLFVVLWSAAYVAIRFGLPDISPLYFLTVRFALAAAALVAIVALFRLPWASAKGIWHHLAIAGVLINAFYLAGAYLALQYVNAATMALIAALHPLLTAFMARPLLGEVLRPVQWIGLALGLAGVALVVGEKAVQVDSLTGALIGFGGVACLALGTIHYRKHCRDADLMVANAVQCLAAVVVCAAMTWALEDVRVVWSWEVLGALFYLAFVSSIGVILLLMFMLRRNQAGKVASNFYLIPGVTALIGWMALGETLSAPALSGFIVASLGVWLAHRGKPRPLPDHAVKRK